ncbi:HEAT repeat domain-containing protein [Peribacillus kribbensis]|uniref:HEAT repeat domain-containing protein n=1 Tax=Peribacillus kribbensis TaxID=356658 RepID=UPI0004190844|nr:HEAT repeat domain-containing protein [Peribacillus kribbensis]
MLHREIWILVSAAGFISIFLFLMLSYLISRKAYENHQRKNIDDIKKRLEPLLAGYLLDENRELHIQADTKPQKIALEEILSSFSAVLSGNSAGRITAAARKFLIPFYQKQLKSRLWSARMNALYHLDKFSLFELEEELIRLAGRNKSSSEASYSMRILASADYPGIIDLLKKAGEMPEFEYRKILYRFSEKRFDEMVLGFYLCPDSLKLAVLDCMGLQKRMPYALFLEHTAEKNKGEIRLRALKAIASIGLIEDISPYLHLAQSEEWQERMLAARLFGIVKEERLKPQLVELLRDKNWWVRYQAGKSLKSFKQGDEILSSIYHHDQDPFARDMAWEWVNKGAVT